MKFARKFLAVGAAVAAIGFGAPAQADVYAGIFEDVTFTITEVDADTFTLRIQGILDTTGGWADADSLEALGFKDLGGGPFDDTSTIAPGTATASNNELNANGCEGGLADSRLCFDFTPSFAPLTNDMLFTVNVEPSDLAINPDLGPHLKLLFLDANGDKVGSLLSKNLPLDDGEGPPQQIPEPGSILLLGASLIALGAVRRRSASR